MASTGTTAKEWLARTRSALRQGEYLSAYDIAIRGSEEHPGDVWLKYKAVLALARSGATERAEELYDQFGLDGVETEDVASLSARIAKDRYLSMADEAPGDAAKSAQLYEAVFEKTGGYYPAINAATMWYFAGEDERSAALARKALELSRDTNPGNGETGYWTAATMAEAALLLDDAALAGTAIEEAGKLHGNDFSAAAATRKQLIRICRAKGIDPAILDSLKPPMVIFYSGHMIAPPGGAGRFAASSEEDVKEKIAEALDRNDVGFGYGSIACGSDILFAEALLERGAEIRVVIPFDLEEFKEISVKRGGAGWNARMEACLERAASVTQITKGHYLGDDSLFAHSSRVAMGFARIKALNLSTDLKMIAVWDGKPPDRDAGTSVDLDFWRQHGLDDEIIDCGPPAAGEEKARAPVRNNPGIKRLIYPVIFADVKGFSKLTDDELVTFFEKVMGKLGEVLDRHSDKVLFRNTWGDALHAVFSDVPTAARCALELQAAMQSLDAGELGLTDKPGMRIALDVGPVFEGFDYVKQEKTFFGSTLTRAARIEPITPVGEVFVTETFAALSAFDCGEETHCEYVGHMPLASSYGRMRMYLLKPVHQRQTT